MNLTELRARLREKSVALPPLKLKALAEASSPEDRLAFKTALDEIEPIEEQLALAEREEAIQAKSSVLAIAPATDGEIRAPAKPKELDPTQVLALTAASIVVGKAQGKSPFDVLDKEGYGVLATSLKAVNTLVSSEGGILVPAPMIGGIMPLLRKQSTFMNAGPVRVPLTNGKFVQPRGLAGATASYVAEGALKPVSTPTFDSINMQSKKLAGIVPITNEARRWTVGDIEGYVRADLQNALALTLDLNAWLGTGAGASPTGVLNKAGIQTLAGTFTSATAPTLAELDTFATSMILKLTTANIYSNGNWRWVMSYRTAAKLSNMRDGNGNRVYPDMQGWALGQGTWQGFPVTVTSQIPTNGGGTTDETTIALVDFTYVLFGEEEGITMKMSDQATLNTTGATDGTGLVHLFQQNMFAILAEAMHDFGLRTALAVVKSTIRW